MPRPPSEQGTSSLPGLATDTVGYQTASSGSDEAVTGLLDRYSGGHTPQDHTVATVASYSYPHSSNLNSRQPPALPVRSHLKHANSVWYPKRKMDVDKLERVQKRATKLIPELSKKSYSDRLKALRYDTRCYFNVRSKADISQLNLPHGTDN